MKAMISDKPICRSICKHHRYPSQVISHAVWLDFRFPLSLRLAEVLLLERGIVVSYETIRCWARKFGPEYARRVKRKPLSRTDMASGRSGDQHRWQEALVVARG